MEILKYKMSLQSSQFALKKTLTSHGPFTRECDPTYPHFGLSQGTNKINKHYHFKEIRG